MTRKRNTAWLDATNPRLATMVATANDATVTATVASIVSEPVTAMAVGPLTVRERRHLAAFMGDCQQVACPTCGASR